MIAKLSDIADIRTGLVVSRKAASLRVHSVHQYRLLTLASIADNGDIIENKLDDFFANQKIQDMYLAKEGDIVVRLSSPNIACYISKEYAGLLVPSQFAIIRYKKKDVLSEYIGVAINSASLQQQLRSAQRGTVIKVINTKALRELNIPVPRIDIQEKIVALEQLSLRRTQLTERLIEKQIIQINFIKDKLIKENS